MNEKLKEAFDQIHAEKELKDRTTDFLFQKTKGYRRANIIDFKHLAAALACVGFFMIGGRWLYFTPTVEISVDINPSVELGVNRFNRIISFEGCNDDGKELVNTLDLKYMKYTDAINEIVKSDYMESLLAEDEIMTIAVVGTDDTQSEEILANVQSCVAGKENTYCYYARSEEVEKAHEMDLSYGKYKAYSELQAIDPDCDITVDEIQDMTMREIKEMINRDSNKEKDGEEKPYYQKGHGKRRQNKR